VRVKRLVGQADLLAKGFHARIVSNKSKFLKCEGTANTHRTKNGHALQGIQGAVSIAEAGEDQRLVKSTNQRPAQPQR